MNYDDHRDRLVDLLLSELVGKETPPDVRARVLESVEKEPEAPIVEQSPSPDAAAAPRLKPLEAPALPVTRRKPIRRRAPMRRRKPSKIPQFAAAAVVALLAGVGAFLYLKQITAARTPVLTAVSGTADRSAGPIPPGESLSTGTGSSAVISYPDGTVIELASETTLAVAEPSAWDRSKRLEIVAGGVQAEVSPQPDGSPMMLTSKDAVAEVVGTTLSFHINDDRTRLEVMEGAVRFVPQAEGKAVLVKSGLFAEVGRTGFRTGAVNVPPTRGITRFTLMNAESDQPIHGEVLVDGETISLASLPTQAINLRADFDGNPPAIVRITVTRQDGGDTGLLASASNDQKHPPFFAAGDHWAEGRPNDCRAWTPRPGLYRLSAQAIYDENAGQSPIKPFTINLRITE